MVVLFLSTTSIGTAWLSYRDCDYHVGTLNIGCYVPGDFKERARNHCDEQGYKLESIYWKPKTESSQINCEVRDNQLFSQLLNNDEERE